MKAFRITVALFFGMFLTMAFSSCGPTRESYLEDFTEFIEDVQLYSSSYTNEMWEQKDAEFKSFTSGERYEEVAQELTSEDKKEIGELTARYYKIKGQDWVNDWVNKIEGGIRYGEGFFDGFFGSDSDEEETK